MRLWRLALIQDLDKTGARYGGGGWFLSKTWMRRRRVVLIQDLDKTGGAAE